MQYKKLKVVVNKLQKNNTTYITAPAIKKKPLSLYKKAIMFNLYNRAIF